MSSPTKSAGIRTAWIASALVLATSPLFFPSAFAGVAARIPPPLGALAWTLIALTPWLCARGLPNSSRSERWAVGLFALILGLYTAEIHRVLVDQTALFPDRTNAEWQLELHTLVLARDPGVIPHAYRFLPDTVAGVLRAGVGDFGQATVLYRIVFQTLIIFALYAWARLYLSRQWALMPPLMYAVVYPMTNVGYAGQLTDPMSHLSFLLAFIFIERGEFQLLAWTIAVGVLAKESVAAMAFAYPFLAAADPKRWRHSAILIALPLVVLIAVRRWIAGGLDYQHVSGVGLEQVGVNLIDMVAIWPRRLLFTVGVWLPFALWRWNEHPRNLRVLAVFLFIALFATNTAFSWLHETRNFVPLIFVLAVLATRRLASVFAPAPPWPVETPAP